MSELNVAIGGYECPCGNFTFGLRSTWPGVFTSSVPCPACGEMLPEVLALPQRGARGDAK